MTAQETAIKTAFEVEEMTPQEISECMGLDVIAVKSCLLNYSTRYRKLCNEAPEEEDTLNYTREEQQRIKDVIMDLAMGAESEKLRFEAAVYIRDDAKGRKDRNNNLPTTNVLVLNNILKQGREMADKIKQIN
jgi:hypothetical protein